jgi:hypothetical protein
MTNLGRETFLLPVTWQDDGWPTILRGDERVALTVKLPQGAAAPEIAKGPFVWTDDFDGKTLKPEWIFIRTPPAEAWHSLPVKPGSLLIEPRDVNLRSKTNPLFIARRQQHAAVSATTALRTDAVRGKSDAGLAAFGNETYLLLGIRVEGSGSGVAHVRSSSNESRPRSDRIPARRRPRRCRPRWLPQSRCPPARRGSNCASAAMAGGTRSTTELLGASSGLRLRTRSTPAFSAHTKPGGSSAPRLGCSRVRPVREPRWRVPARGHRHET